MTVDQANQLRQRNPIHPFRHLGFTLPIHTITSETTRPETGTVIMVHDLGADATSMDSAFSAPALLDYRLITLDLSGHGLTPAPEAPPADLIGDHYGPLIAYLADYYARTGPVHLVGHGMGLAAICAADQIDPDTIHTVISVAGTMTGTDCDRLARGIAQTSTDQFVRTGWTHLVRSARDGTAAGAALRGQLSRVNAVTLHAAATALVQWCDSGRIAQWWTDRADGRRQAHLYGSATGLPDPTRHLCRHTPRVEIPGAGHLPMIDCPRALWEGVAAML